MVTMSSVGDLSDILMYYVNMTFLHRYFTRESSTQIASVMKFADSYVTVTGNAASVMV